MILIDLPTFKFVNKPHMKIIYSLAVLFTFFACRSAAFATNGDTLHVVSHQNVVMTTDTFGSGSQEKKRWAAFPSVATPYRKAFVMMTYRRPAGMTCGEWDYIDQVVLHRVGGVNGEDKNIELVRFITPYGLQFPNGWTFAWHSDVTDFSTLLHDSVEIGYVHTGYETSSGRGWDVTLDFNMVEGPPAMFPLSVTPLWNGSFSFGNDADPIESHLVPIDHTFSHKATLGSVRIQHTGHGADDNGCSEFCDRYRELKWDNALVDQTHLWRRCGFNALYPQGGTWVYNRGNWCPGSVIYPYTHDFPVEPGSTHSVDVDMENYSGTGSLGNEFIRSYLIEYKGPFVENDARVDEIFRPSNMSEYNRINPVCDNPLIQVANMGTNPITSMVINSGYAGQNTFTYTWTGNLQPGATDTVSLANTFMVPSATDQLFTVNIASVNGTADAYPGDNVSSSHAAPTTVTDSVIYLELKTNAEPEETGYTLTDTWGNVSYSRAVGSLAANTVYKDTFHLLNNTCYRLTILDVDPYGGDGLSFWANTAGGSGYARLRKVFGAGFVKQFNADFGSRIEYNFTVGDVVSSVNDLPLSFDVGVSPNPTPNRAVIDYRSPRIGNWQVDVFDVLGKHVFTHTLKNDYGEMLQVDMSDQPAGIYVVRVTQDGQTATRRLSVAR